MRWQLPDCVDRMKVNAALTTLTERWDLEAAFLVIRAFTDLPGLTSKQTETLTFVGPSRDTVRGLTPEHGMVSIEEPEKVRATQTSGPPEDAVAGVGSFKILKLRASRQGIATIAFGPFQIDPLAMMHLKQIQPQWEVFYHERSGLPLALCRVDYEERTLPWHVQIRLFWRRLRTGIPIANKCWMAVLVELHNVTQEELEARTNKPPEVS